MTRRMRDEFCSNDDAQPFADALDRFDDRERDPLTLEKR